MADLISIVALLTCLHCAIAAGEEGAGGSQPQAVVSVTGDPMTSLGRPEQGTFCVPASPAINSVGAEFGPRRVHSVRCRGVIIVIVPIPAPFGDIAGHVMQSPCIGGFLADVMGALGLPNLLTVLDLLDVLTVPDVLNVVSVMNVMNVTNILTVLNV